MIGYPHERKALLPLSWSRTKSRLISFRNKKDREHKNKLIISYPMVDLAPSLPSLSMPSLASSTKWPFISTQDLTALAAESLPPQSTLRPSSPPQPTRPATIISMETAAHPTGLREHPDIYTFLTERYLVEEEAADLDEYRDFLCDNVFTFEDAVNERTNLTDRLDAARNHLHENITIVVEGTTNELEATARRDAKAKFSSEQPMKLHEHLSHIEKYFCTLKEYALSHGWNGPGSKSLQKSAPNMEYQDLPEDGNESCSWSTDTSGSSKPSAVAVSAPPPTPSVRLVPQESAPPPSPPPPPPPHRNGTSSSLSPNLLAVHGAVPSSIVPAVPAAPSFPPVSPLSPKVTGRPALAPIPEEGSDSFAGFPGNYV